MRALRVSLVAVVAMAALSFASSSALALTVGDTAGDDPCPAISGTFGSQSPFTGGCAVTAHSSSSTLTLNSDSRTCTVDIDAVVDGSGGAAINALTVTGPGAQPDDCTQIQQCELDPPFLPWEANITFSSGVFRLKLENFCVDTPFGTVQGDVTGTITGSSCGTNCLTEGSVVFATSTPIFVHGTATPSGATLAGTYVLSPDTLYVQG